MVSLVLNLALAAVLALRGKPLPPNLTGDNGVARIASASAPADGQMLKPMTVSGSAAPAMFGWQMVESDDYKKYIANLRAIGCPEKTVRDIIVADVNELFRERGRGAQASTNRLAYWKSGDLLGNLFNEETVAKQQELAREKRELLKTLLGDSAPTGLETAAMADNSQQIRSQLLDFLPADKQTPLMELEQKHRAKLMKALKDVQQGDPMAMRKTKAENDAEMLQLLTPEQKFEYDLRMSHTASIMRMQMGDLEPTEQQFRDMFKLKKAFDDEFGQRGTMAYDGKTMKDKQRRDAAQKVLDAQLRSILGEDGYRLYTYEQRWTYDPLNPVATENKLPKQTAFKVFDLQNEAQAQAARVRANQTLSPHQRAATLNAMRAETERAIGQVLGSAAAQAYLARADWIKLMGK